MYGKPRAINGKLGRKLSETLFDAISVPAVAVQSSQPPTQIQFLRSLSATSTTDTTAVRRVHKDQLSVDDIFDERVAVSHTPLPQRSTILNSNSISNDLTNSIENPHQISNFNSITISHSISLIPNEQRAAEQCYDFPIGTNFGHELVEKPIHAKRTRRYVVPNSTLDVLTRKPLVAAGKLKATTPNAAMVLVKSKEDHVFAKPIPPTKNITAKPKGLGSKSAMSTRWSIDRYQLLSIDSLCSKIYQRLNIFCYVFFNPTAFSHRILYAIYLRAYTYLCTLADYVTHAMLMPCILFT